MNETHAPARSRLPLVLGAVFAAAIACGALWWSKRHQVETTDNAYAAADSVAISAKVSGYVTAVPVQLNQSARKGDTLIVIDDADYKLRVEQAEAQMRAQQAAIATIQQQLALQRALIAQAAAALQGAQARADKATSDYERSRSLIEQGYVTQEHLDGHRSTARAADAALAEAAAQSQAVRDQIAVLTAQRTQLEAEMVQARAGLDQTRLDQGHTVITAPIDGVIGNRNVQVGEYVRPGVRLFTLVPLSQVYIVANFKETQIERMRVGQRVDVRFDAYPKLHVVGTLESFAPATGSEFALLPPQNATGNFTKIVQRVPVKIALPWDKTLEGKIRPGLSAVVSIDRRQTTAGAPLVMSASDIRRTKDQ